MSPELLEAVKERVELGHDDERIREELRQAGHVDEVINGVIQAARTATPTTPIPPVDSRVTFPGARSLVADGFAYMRKRLDLATIIAIPLVLIAFFEILIENEAYAAWSLLLIPILIVYVFFLIAVLRIVITSDTSDLSFTEGLTWARRHFFGWVWVQILAGLVVMGGFMLLIIPGIILSLYTYFAQFVYVKEEVGGMQAVLRSRDLVMGNWWSLFVVLFKVSLLFIGIFVLIGIAFGMVSVGIPENDITVLIGNVVIQILSAGITIIGLHIGMSLYKSLANMKPATATKQPAGGYIALAVLGLLFPILITAVIVAAVTLNPELQDPEQFFEQMEVEAEVSDEAAKQRALELRNLE